jgi:hypothetical protein
MRMFCSDVEDKAWFHDREFWRQYLSMLVAQRFNRFNLAFGIGYDFTREIQDAYLHFSYPFLLQVPGYDVRATGLGDAERQRNLETLRFVSDEAAARGLRFQLGLWTHAYEWTDSPQANHRIEGLTPRTHGAYCRDALSILLKECPSISGMTFRIHGESGVAEGSYDFWSTVFDGVVRAGRPLEIDLHAKGMDQRLIEIARATALPVTVSPKFWADTWACRITRRGSPHRAAPRAHEAFANNSGRAASALRYGDLLAGDQRYGIIHRIRLWPCCGGIRSRRPMGAIELLREPTEIMEPLSFKGKKGRQAAARPRRTVAGHATTTSTYTTGCGSTAVPAGRA